MNRRAAAGSGTAISSTNTIDKNDLGQDSAGLPGISGASGFQVSTHSAIYLGCPGCVEFAESASAALCGVGVAMQERTAVEARWKISMKQAGNVFFGNQAAPGVNSFGVPSQGRARAQSRDWYQQLNNH